MRGLALVADIGDTHTHLALASVGPSRPELHEVRSLLTPDGAPLGLLREYLQAQLQTHEGLKIDAAAVAASGRIRRLPGRISISLNKAQLTLDRDDLAGATQAPVNLLVNDLAAVASALPLLTASELLAVGPSRLPGHGVQIVVGIGSGFGVAVLTADGALLETQVGHTDLAAVSAEERLWLNRLSPLGRMSVETLISAPGLAKLHEAVGGAADVAVEAIAAQALYGEPAARKAVMAFSRWLGRVVGNLILHYGAWSGVYLCGSVMEDLDESFDATAFRHSMEDRAPLSADIAAVPVYRIHHAQPALLGLARLALSH